MSKNITRRVDITDSFESDLEPFNKKKTNKKIESGYSLYIFILFFITAGLSVFYFVTPASVNAKSLDVIAQRLSDIAPSAGNSVADDLLSWGDDSDANKIIDSKKTSIGLNKKVIAAPVKEVSAAKVSSVEDNNITKRIEDIEIFLGKLEDHFVKKEDILLLKKSIDSLNKEISTIKLSKNKQLSRKKVEEKTFSKKTRIKNVSKNKKVAKKTGWILKSAKTGMAWVAKKGSNELKTISIGDDLPGAGRIEDITQNKSGRWVVKTSTGYISQ